MRRVRAALSLAGFGCLVAAAWLLSPAAGFAAAGVACLVTEYLTGPNEGTQHGRV